MRNSQSHELALDEKARLRAAAARARNLYPGPVGEIVAREIIDWEIFGYRFGGSSLIMDLVDQLLKSPDRIPAHGAQKI